MRFLALAVLLLFHGFLLATDDKPTIRAVIVGDTITDGSQEAARYSIWRMKKNLENIARNIECPLQLSILSDDKFSIAEIKNWIHALPNESNDIVFFYYVGHGGQDGLDKPWPVLYINPVESFSTTLGASAIVKCLKQNHQRLAIILFEACNSEPKVMDHVSTLERGVVISDRAKLPGLRRLFLCQRGYVIATSSKPGEVSYYRDRKPIGGFFSTGFTLALIKKCHHENENVSWKKIFSSTAKFCLKKTKGYLDGTQHPIYSIE